MLEPSLESARQAIRRPCAVCRKVPVEPVVSPSALARISRSALSIARIAKEARSSSGEKHTALAAPDVTEAAGTAGEIVARTSGRAIENTPKLWRISLNSFLPCPDARQIIACAVAISGPGLSRRGKARGPQQQSAWHRSDAEVPMARGHLSALVRVVRTRTGKMRLVCQAAWP